MTIKTYFLDKIASTDSILSPSKKKETMSMIEHMHKIKTIRDAPDVIGEGESYHNLVMIAFLEPQGEYRGFASALNTH